jgi:hypothetical protein
MFQFQIEARDERDLLRGTISFEALCPSLATARRALCDLVGDEPSARSRAEALDGFDELLLSSDRWREIRVAVAA